MLLVLTALVATIVAGCGGSAGSSQPSSEKQASGTADPAEQKPGSTGPTERAQRDKLGHPALGSMDAPVVLTEYSDYQ